MALEAAEEQHDCCPPEIRLDAMECCVIDDVTHDARGSRLWLDDDGSAEIAELAELQPAYAEKKPDEPEYDPSEDDDDSSIFDILQRAHAVVRRR